MRLASDFPFSAISTSVLMAVSLCWRASSRISPTSRGLPPALPLTPGRIGVCWCG